MKHFISLSTVFCLLLGTLSPAYATPINDITGGPDSSGAPNTNIALNRGPDSNLNWQVTGSGTIPVHLYVPSGTLSMTVTDGLTFTGSPTGSSLYFSGDLSHVNAALATLRYSNSSNGTYTVEMSLVEAGQIVYPLTHHVYEVVNNGSPITATDARAAALARTYGGVSGYLANITSSDENAFVAARITQDGWFGASDITTEGTWQWLDGPVEEAGSTFWTGLGNGVASGYENWSNGEPNNQGNEDCSEFYANGSGWNDLPCDWGGIDTYVVEYGSTLTGGGPSSASDSLDVTITADTTTQSPTLTSPTSTSRQNTLQLTYTLPEVAADGTVHVSFNNGTTTTTLTMSNSQSVNTTVNLASLTSTSGVTSATAASLADGTYTVTLSYQDYLSNPASTAIASAVIIDTTVLAPGVNIPFAQEVIRTPTYTTTGTCETGATVSISNIYLQTNPTTVVCSGGIFSASISFLISAINTPIALSYTQTDLASNVSSATVKNVYYALQTGSSGGDGGQTKNEEKRTPKETTIPVQDILSPVHNSTELQEKTIENIPLNSAEEKTSCEIHVFLTKAIKLGAKNNPEDVKLLEQFLNTYEQANLPVDGIYSREDYQAVIKWQEKYTDDVLKPWGLKKGSGYVYIKSLAKIREIEEKACTEQKGQ